jgi:acyl-CoA thioesterase FadM
LLNTAVVIRYRISIEKQFRRPYQVNADVLGVADRGMAAVQQNIAYKRELLAGDVVEVRSVLLELRDKAIRFLHEMRACSLGMAMERNFFYSLTVKVSPAI